MNVLFSYFIEFVCDSCKLCIKSDLRSQILLIIHSFFCLIIRFFVSLIVYLSYTEWKYLQQRHEQLCHGVLYHEPIPHCPNVRPEIEKVLWTNYGKILNLKLVNIQEHDSWNNYTNISKIFLVNEPWVVDIIVLSILYTVVILTHLSSQD